MSNASARRDHEHYTDAEAVAMAPEPVYPEPTPEAQVVAHYDLDRDNERHQELVVDYLRRGRALEAIQRRAQDAMSLRPSRPMSVVEAEAEAKRAAKHQADADAAMKAHAEDLLAELLAKDLNSPPDGATAFANYAGARFAIENPALSIPLSGRYRAIARQVWEAGR